MVTYAGEDGVGRVSCTSCRPSSSRRRTSAIRRPGSSIRRSASRPRPARRCPSPTSTPTSRASRGCSEERPGRAPATTSANPSTSATSSTGTPPAWARASRTSTSARTCGSAMPPSPSTDEPAPPPQDARRRRSPPLNDFGVRNDLQLRGIKPWESGELQIGVPGHRELQQQSRPRRRMGRHRPVRAEGARRRQQARRPVRQGWGNGLRDARALLLPRLLALQRPERDPAAVRRRAHHSARRPMVWRPGGRWSTSTTTWATRGR